jgi:hypothetical protein
MLQWMWKSYRDEVKSRRISQEVIGKALETGSPMSYFRSHMDDWDDIRGDDFMLLLRTMSEIEITSHEISDIYERWRHADNAALGILDDIQRLIRDKAAKEEDGRNTSS